MFVQAAGDVLTLQNAALVSPGGVLLYVLSVISAELQIRFTFDQFC